ncbi:hypothetical protein, partial [Pseudomonas sp. GW531-R1]|uniref:hypothetical protein n=1 Tax=Pseudomonas sp. GW531-R1 TaxID=2075556 RepID=UPI001305065D
FRLFAMCIFFFHLKRSCKYLHRSKTTLARLQALTSALLIVCVTSAHAQNASDALDAATIENQIAQGDSWFNGYDKRALQVLAEASRASL